MKHEIRKGKSGGAGGGTGGGAGGDLGGDSWGNGCGPARAVDPSGGGDLLILLVVCLLAVVFGGGCAAMNSTTHVEYSPKSQAFTYDQVNTPLSAEVTDTSATLRAVRHNADGTQDVVEARIQRKRSEDPRAAVGMWDRAMSGLHDLGLVLVGWLSHGTAP